MTKILVTGMSGLIGGVVRSQLGGDYELSALNRRSVDGIPTVQADIGDFEPSRVRWAGCGDPPPPTPGSAPWDDPARQPAGDAQCLRSGGRFTCSV
ncbi:MAG: hypothetical protein R2856_35030 [Caldilineaceae bacterium]